jgi:hypothetical protein
MMAVTSQMVRTLLISARCTAVSGEEETSWPAACTAWSSTPGLAFRGPVRTTR